MSGPTKRHRTKHNNEALLRMRYRGQLFAIPKSVAQCYRVEDDEQAGVSAEQVFAELNERYTRAGALLKGLRHREGMTQKAFASKVSINQADLSKMENGHRAIGKTIAKRVQSLFDVDYRLFLE